MTEKFFKTHLYQTSKQLCDSNSVHYTSTPYHLAPPPHQIRADWDTRPIDDHGATNNAINGPALTEGDRTSGPVLSRGGAALFWPPPLDASNSPVAWMGPERNVNVRVHPRRGSNVGLLADIITAGNFVKSEGAHSISAVRASTLTKSEGAHSISAGASTLLKSEGAHPISAGALALINSSPTLQHRVALVANSNTAAVRVQAITTGAAEVTKVS